MHPWECMNHVHRWELICLKNIILQIGIMNNIEIICLHTTHTNSVVTVCTPGTINTDIFLSCNRPVYQRCFIMGVGQYQIQSNLSVT